MNKHIMIASAIILGAAVAFAETPQLEQQLKELSRAPVDYAVAGKWFKIAKDIANDGQRQEALKAAAAALIFVHKGDVYQKNVRTQIEDAATFEEEFLQECPDCHGGGESERPCPVCKGTGRCQYANCQDGTHRIHQINGDRYEPCRECKGSGQCQKCKGEGNVKGKCVRCGGRGKSMDKELVRTAYRKHAEAVARFVQEEREQRERERKEAEEKARKEQEREERERRQAEERAEREREREERRRENENVVQGEGGAATKKIKPQTNARNYSVEDSRTDAFPVPFSTGSISFETVFVGALNAGGDPQYDIFYADTPIKRLIIRMDENELSDKWGLIPFLVVTGDEISKFHEAWEMAEKLSSINSSLIHEVPNPKPFDLKAIRIPFPKFHVWYMSPRGEADADRMSICEEPKLAFHTVESDESRFSDGFENVYFFLAQVRRSAIGQSWWHDSPYEGIFSIEFHPEMNGGEPLSKLAMISNPAYLERCWRNRGKTSQVKTFDTSTPKEAWTNLKLPLLPGNVCIPNSTRKNLIYLGKCGKNYNVFFRPGQENNGKRENEALYIEVHEYEVLKRLGWTPYMKLEGKEIDSFHSAWRTTFDRFKEVDRRAKSSQIPPNDTLCRDFKVTNLQYFSPAGNLMDFNQAIPETYYVPGDVNNGRREPGQVLFGMTVQRHTGELTGQQGWWKDPPFKMLFGLIMVEHEVETLLTFTDRGYLEQAIQAARREQQ